MKFMVCQIGGCTSAGSREFKIAATEKRICKYNINLRLLIELNFNWSKVKSSANLALWFCEEEREMQCITLYNTQENDEKHQPGGTGMLCRREFLQYARKPSRALGR
jgi:hypothetical protein